jgi:hypothetical protein
LANHSTTSGTSANRWKSAELRSRLDGGTDTGNSDELTPYFIIDNVFYQ